MANTDAPFGLRPVGHLFGLDWADRMETFYCPATDSTAIFKGDLVNWTGTADTLGEYPVCDQTAATETTIAGVAWAFSTTPFIAADPTNHERIYRPASTAMYVKVITDPFVVYEIQEDGDSDTLGAADVGQACDVVVGSGSTTTGLSAMELDSSGTGATGQLKILRLAKRDDGSNVLGAYAIWRVLINEHYYKLDAGA